MNEEYKYYHLSDTLIDVLVGASDGIIIPFIVIAGLVGVNFTNPAIAFIGTGSAIAGGIVMFFSAYSAGREQIKETGKLSAKEQKILGHIGVDDDVKLQIEGEVAKEKTLFTEYAESYELKQPANAKKMILISAATIGISYIASGLIPTLPFRFMYDIQPAMITSSAITTVLLFSLGFFRAKVTGRSSWQGALRLTFMGVAGAWAAYYIAGLFL